MSRTLVAVVLIVVAGVIVALGAGAPAWIAVVANAGVCTITIGALAIDNYRQASARCG